MANSKELRRRIKSIKNTSQITKAMQMVAATKMKRAQSQALSGRPYMATLSYALHRVCKKISVNVSPLLQSSNEGKIVVVAFSSDKGLCGALNSNIFRVIASHPGFSQNDTVFLTRGRKIRDFLIRTGRILEADFENFDYVDFSQAVEIRKYLLSDFSSGKIKEAFILYPDFISTIQQEPELIRILPIDANTLLEQCKENIDNIPLSNEFLFEPSEVSVLEYALIHLLDIQIYQAILETKASEHSARMIAMQNATNNAKDLVVDLTLNYNQARQGAITSELLEIASAGAALEAA